MGECQIIDFSISDDQNITLKNRKNWQVPRLKNRTTKSLECRKEYIAYKTGWYPGRYNIHQKTAVQETIYILRQVLGI